ncbi:MAG: Peptidase M23 [Candidatus Woesebacteria bacterium GW2011_GWA1_39_21]|uniref:Peptidase M23 n=1 Tax=Candidatus Woesebacteria bacterium GW2011_GWA1_39_21 TaxID=1618550 RepID=A0A0G0N524_9BACT|nr:MAG: Peptidase M23 [Candidatus Woesebacteria bacterium GW2011_GWA1_39_21]
MRKITKKRRLRSQKTAADSKASYQGLSWFMSLSNGGKFTVLKLKRWLTHEVGVFFLAINTLRGVKKGNRVSRVFRLVFENNKTQKVIGINLAALFLSTSLVQFPYDEKVTPDESFITKAPFVLETKKSIQYPVGKIVITQGYKVFHPGLDFDGVTGDPVRPIMDGVVEDVSYSKYAYGNAILINHGNKITSLYAHLSKILVKPNQEVTTDVIIGLMGASGHASGDHLHLEIRDNGKPFNPLTVLPK